MRGGENGRDEAACYVHRAAPMPRYNTPFLSRCHPKGASSSWHPHWCLGPVTFHMCAREFVCLRPGDPSAHFCLLLSLPSHLFLSGRPRCDSTFPISETIGALGEGGSEREGARRGLPQCSLASVCSQLVCGNAGGRKANSTRCHFAEHCPGSVSVDSHGKAETPAHFILWEGLDQERIP